MASKRGKEGKENYLRTIYELQEHDKAGVKSVDIAHKLNISKASVSEMLRKLAKLGLIKIKPYSKIFLTSQGRKVAGGLFDKHFIIKSFMKKILKYNEERAREEAHKLEHAFSHESVELLNNIIEGKYAEETYRMIKPIPSYIG